MNDVDAGLSCITDPEAAPKPHKAKKKGKLNRFLAWAFDDDYYDAMAANKVIHGGNTQETGPDAPAGGFPTSIVVGGF